MTNIITSSSNNYIKKINKLRRKKYRSQEGLFIIETKKLIDEAIKSNLDIEFIFRKESAESIYEDEIILSDSLFREISSLISPDGYLAILRKKKNNEISNKVLILDGIQDPGNMGTLIRSAEAFGFNSILSINSVDYYNEKVLRAGMGSTFRLNLLEVNYEYLETLKDYNIFIADMDGEDYRNIEVPNKIAIVIGNEGNGISQDILKIDHQIVKIPMEGDIESLNAGVSGSILMSRFS